MAVRQRQKAGDCAVITGEKGSYVVYFSGDGDVKWQAQANNSLMNDQYDKDYHALEEKYPVTVSNSGVAKISEITLNTSSSSN